MCFASEFEGVGTEYLRKGIGHLVGVVGLCKLVRRSARGIAIEIKILDAFAFWIERHDAGTSIGILKPLRNEAYVDTTRWLAEIVSSRV
jgi:hypothetical protein